MVIKIRLLLFVLFAFTGLNQIHAQATDTSKPLRIAVLAPLYIDSAFNDYTYKLGENSIPQYILSGLDFYNGVMLAIDSLQQEGAHIEVFIYDTKSTKQTLNELCGRMKFMNFSLIIASLNNSLEQSTFSAFSFENNIPFISVTYPNDANVNANPFFVLLNSTIKTHTEAIYKFAQKNYGSAKTVFITKKGYLEEKVWKDFTRQDTLAKQAKLKYKPAELADNFTPADILPLLDSTKQNLLICGSFNQGFGVKLVQTISAAKSYRTTIIGMPDWDGFRDLNKETANGVEIVYTSPFNFSRNDKAGYAIATLYKNKYFARPSDMVFKGFESMYHFSHLVVQYHNDLINHLSDNSFKISNEFSIQPVKINPQSFIPDYQENKTIYFIRKLNGTLVSVSR